MQFAKHLAELALPLLIAQIPSIVVASAWGIAFLRRATKVERRIDGRMDSLLSTQKAEGILEGFRESILLAREDRREVVNALLTPSPRTPEKG